MPDLAIGYLRVSTDEQVKSGAGLDAQRAEIEAFAAARGFTVSEWFVDEGVSGGTSPMKRPELSKALEALRAGPASMLLFRRSDRVGRKASDLLALRDCAESEGWHLAAADGSVDNSTPHGRLMFTQLAGFAEFERDLIRSRTREGLAAKRAAGVRLGRPATLPDDVVARIIREHGEDGRGWTAIANGLMADGVPTAQGGVRWYPATVRKVWQGQDAAKLRATVAS